MSSSVILSSNNSSPSLVDLANNQIDRMQIAIEVHGSASWKKYHTELSDLSSYVDKMVKSGAIMSSSTLVRFTARLEETQTIFINKGATSLEHRVNQFSESVCKESDANLLVQYEKISHTFKALRRELDVFNVPLRPCAQVLVQTSNAHLLRMKKEYEERLRAFDDRIQKSARLELSETSLSSGYSSSSSNSTSSTKTISRIATVNEDLDCSLILETAKQLRGLLVKLSEGQVEKVLYTLNTLTMELFFQVSGRKSTIWEQVYFHNQEHYFRDVSSLKQAIRRTCIELGIEGFSLAVDQYGEESAEKMYEGFFTKIGIWDQFLRHKFELGLWSDLPEERQEPYPTAAAISQMIDSSRSFRNQWSLPNKKTD